MTGIHSPPEPVKQQGILCRNVIPLCESNIVAGRDKQCLSVVRFPGKKQISLLETQKVGLTDWAGLSACLSLSASACLPACPPTAGKGTRSVYSDP